MAKNSMPWDLNPELQPDRLSILAREVAAVRSKLANLYSPEEGDTPWSLGCQAYSRICYRIGVLAASGEHSWLRVHRDGLYFTFYVGGVSFKFYRGTADSPSSRSLRAGLKEQLAQERLKFYDDEILKELSGWTWLMAIDTDAEGRVLEVVVFEANAQRETRNVFSVPLDGAVRVLAAVSDKRPDGVQQAPATIGLAGEADDEDEEAGDEEVEDDDRK